MIANLLKRNNDKHNKNDDSPANCKRCDKFFKGLWMCFLLVAAFSLYVLPKAAAQNATNANTTDGNSIAIPQGASLPPSTEEALYMVLSQPRQQYQLELL